MPSNVFITELPVVVDYRPEWPQLFAAERDRLQRLLEPRPARIEHIGGTAVPGMPGKDVVDLLVGIEDPERKPEYIAELEKDGYSADAVRLYKRGRENFNLWVTPVNGDLWLSLLAWRDHLRQDPVAAAEYGVLKREASKRGYFATYNHAKIECFLAWVQSIGGWERIKSAHG